MTTPATIMVAEDDVTVRELMNLALEINGFNAVAVANTKEAVACFESRRVDLLLLDLGLGSESGIDLLKAVRLLPTGKDVPVILLTGRSDRDTVLQIAQLGVQGYVLKHQVSRKDLMARIHQQLGSRATSSPTIDHAGAAEAADGAEMPGAAGDAVPAESLRELKPLVTREQTLRHVDKCAELKALSPTVAQLISVTAQPDCSIEQIARIVRRDQVLTLKFLKIANSVVYKRAGVVDTVQMALSRIGVAQVRQLALNISVVDKFHVGSQGEHFNSGLFWEHSIATGLIAAAITRFRGGDERAIDGAFTMGLLHDVARMVFAEQFGDIYKRVLETASRLQLPLEQVETRMLLLNHADLMDRVLDIWRFPRSLAEPIAMHHLSAGNIRSIAPRIVGEACTLALANRYAHALLLGSSGNNCQYPTDEFVEVLQLKAEAITFIEERIPQQTSDMKGAMLESGHGGEPGQDYRQLVLKNFRRPIRALYVSANAATDGFRILFDRLAHTDGPDRPNVAVVHLADIDERESLFKALRERETGAGLEPLPLIVISPLVNPTLEPRLLAGRMCKVMPSPFTLSRLADAVNGLIPDDAD
jgi:HD-like signal output (HDOD) protein/CheY-like chemotaxis protein